MPSPKADRLPKLESAESLTVLRGPQTSAETFSSVNNDDAIALRLSILRGRLVLLSVLPTAVLVAIMLIFSREGVVLDHFLKGDLTAKKQQDLLEQYNSYSGITTTAIERPLSMVVGLLVHILVLRMITGKVLQVEPSVCVRASVIALGAGFGYLLANGLSALNVQMHELPVQPVISTQDLHRELDTSGTSTVDASYSDGSAQNPVVNTILRNLILPRSILNDSVCTSPTSMDTYDTVTIDIPQLPWMKSLLAEALEFETMQIVVDTADASANSALTPDQFPMNASVAADLLLCGVGSQSDMYAFFDFFSDDTMATNFPTSAERPIRNESAARLAGLIAPNASASEEEDRAWFLKHSGTLLYNTTGGKMSSLRSWTMNLSRVNITPSIWMDAVTIEREMASEYLETARSKDGNTRYYVTMDISAQGKHVPILKNDTTDSNIQMFAVCLNDNGEDTLTAQLQYEQEGPTVLCSNKSASSLLVVSYTKRFIADELIVGATANASGVFNSSDGENVVIDLREVICWTFARLTWTLQNLSERFGAECMDAGGCLGLEADLPMTGQRLVVGAAALPVPQVSLLFFDMFWVQQPVNLVSVVRPQHYYERNGGDFDGWLGDFLMPHNVRKLSGATAESRADCIGTNQLRLATYVNNHAYMDSTLQAAYTAATFFLLQNGVAHDVVNQSQSLETLAFSQNVQRIDLRAYIPQLNAYLTLGGCAALLCALFVTFLWSHLASKASPDPLQNITMPHAIACVLVDGKTFPSELLQRSVMGEATDTISDVDAMAITSIRLERKNRDDGKGGPELV